MKIKHGELQRAGEGFSPSTLNYTLQIKAEEKVLVINNTISSSLPGYLVRKFLHTLLSPAPHATLETKEMHGHLVKRCLAPVLGD